MDSPDKPPVDLPPNAGLAVGSPSGDVDRPTGDGTWDEISMLQDKIDKIGDFRFRVKTWSISVMTAVLAGGIVLRLPPESMLITLLSILLFLMLEEQQKAWHEAFTERINEIYDERRRRFIFDNPGQPAKHIKSKLLAAIARKTRQLRDKGFRGYAVLRADYLFYFGQFVIVAAFYTMASFHPAGSQKVDVNLIGTERQAQSSPAFPKKKCARSTVSPSQNSQ